MAERCQHEKADGVRCGGNALPGSAYCYQHDPDRADERREARSAGGRARSRPRATLPCDTPDARLETVADVIALLALTVNQVRRGELDVKVGSCVGYLSNILVGALKLGPIEERLAALEAIAEGQRKRFQR